MGSCRGRAVGQNMFEEQVQERAFNKALDAWHSQLNTREVKRTKGWDAEQMTEDVVAKVEQVLDNLERGDLGWGVPTDVTLDLGTAGGTGLHSVTVHVTTSLVLGKETREQKMRRRIYRALVTGTGEIDPAGGEDGGEGSDSDDEFRAVARAEACEDFLAEAESYGRGEGSTSRALRKLVDAGGLDFLKRAPHSWDESQVSDMAERLEGYAHDGLRPPFEFYRSEMTRAKWAWYSGEWDGAENLANGTAMRRIMPNLNVRVDVGVEPDPLHELRKEYVEQSGSIVRGVWRRELSEEELAEQRRTHARITELGGGYEGIMAALNEKGGPKKKGGKESAPAGPTFTDALARKLAGKPAYRMPRDELRAAVAAGLTSGQGFIARLKADKEAKAAARKAKRQAREKENDNSATPAAKKRTRTTTTPAAKRSRVAVTDELPETLLQRQNTKP